MPAAGDYLFAIQDTAPDAAFTLKLDDSPLIDSGQGLNQQSTTLAQGVYRLNLDYRSGSTPGDLSVQWQPPRRHSAGTHPGHDDAPAPRAQLKGPARRVLCQRKLGRARHAAPEGFGSWLPVELPAA